jgi:hypothetical protein
VPATALTPSRSSFPQWLRDPTFRGRQLPLFPAGGCRKRSILQDRSPVNRKAEQAAETFLSSLDHEKFSAAR